MGDIYLYEGTDVLKNLFNIRVRICYIISDRHACCGLVERSWSNRLGGDSLRHFY